MHTTRIANVLYTGLRNYTSVLVWLMYSQINVTLSETNAGIKL